MSKSELINSKTERISYLKHISDLTEVSIEFNELDKKNQFDNYFKTLKIKADNKTYPDWIFFFQDDDTCCVELNLKNGNLYCSHRHIWRVYEKDYLMLHNEIQSFIKNRVEEHFKMLSVTPYRVKIPRIHKVEEHFKLLSVTPNPATDK